MPRKKKLKKDFERGRAERPRNSEERSEETEHKFNDVSWYTKNQQQLVDAASYSYNNALGSQVSWDLIDPTTPYTMINGTAIPGLMSFGVMMCPGKSLNASSPANVAGQNIYSYVRYMNSGAKNYDQQDMLMYCLAMDSIYACWNWMKRIYGYLRTYSQFNRYMPKVYAAADKVNFDDLIGQLSDFRLYLNQAAAKISAFCVPSVMPIFVRHSWMFSNIYADSNTLKAQQYMFVPYGFYSLNELGTSGTELTFNTLTGVKTLAQLRSLLDDMINKVAYSEDVGIMSGDILKAYGESQLFKLAPVDPDYTVLPVYNEEVLNQMHNSTSYQLKGIADTSNNITQDPNRGYLIWNPKFNANSRIYEARMINMPWDNVTPANNMVGTRLTNVLEETASGDVVLSSCGSEVIVDRSIYYYKYTAASGAVALLNFDCTRMYVEFGTANVTSLGNAATALCMLSQFDWHPLYGLELNDGTSNQFCGLLGDVSNYTQFTAYDLEKLHYTAIMSEFNIPQIGSF